MNENEKKKTEVSMPDSVSGVKGFMLYFDQYPAIKMMTAEQKAMLLDAMFMRFAGHEYEITDPVVSMAFSFFEQSHARNLDRMQERTEKARANVQKRWEKYNRIIRNTNDTNDTTVYDRIIRNTNDTIQYNRIEENRIEDNTKDINTAPKKGASRSRFVPPSVAEVEAYCQERHNGISGQEFVDHYTACGWVYGAGKKPVKDWRACVRTWENNRRQQRPTLFTPQPRAKPGEFDMDRQRRIAQEIIEEMEAEDAQRYNHG